MIVWVIWELGGEDFRIRDGLALRVRHAKFELVDTMWNFILYALSALTAAITGYFTPRS
ncbi:MAG: hypothetical protein ACPGJR_12115 [Akkermansiaceae bacterium]